MKAIVQALHWWGFKPFDKGDHKICLQRI